MVKAAAENEALTEINVVRSWNDILSKFVFGPTDRFIYVAHGKVCSILFIGRI